MNSILGNLDSLSKESLLELAEKCYRSVYVNKEFYQTVFQQSMVLPLSPENQQMILDATVNSYKAKKYPPPLSFRKYFLKIFLKAVEGSGYDVSEELFIAYANSLAENSSPDSLWFHCYFVNEAEIVIQENSSLVVNSTTGLKTWDAAKCLTEWCIENSHLFKNRHILELGSGTGLVGIGLCKFAEPSRFTFTDRSPDVLRLISSNLHISHLSADTSSLHQNDEVALDNNILLCDNLHTREFYCKPSCKIDVCHLEWESILKQQAAIWSPDVILAADVIYDPSSLPHLVHVIHTFLINGAQCAFVACIIRNTDTHMCFLNHLDSCGLKSHELPGPEKLELFYDNTSCLKIYKIIL